MDHLALLPTSPRGRRTTADTADVRIDAWAEDLPALFEEAAEALARVIADLQGEPPAAVWHAVILEAPDLPAMAHAWLNELIGLSDMHHAALVGVSVDRLAVGAAPDGRASWSLRAKVGLRPFSGRDVRARREVRAATFQRLTVRQDADAWTLNASLAV